MKVRKILIICALMLLGLNIAYGNFVPLRVDVEGEHPRVELLYQDLSRVEFEVRLPGVKLSEEILDGRTWDRVEIPGGGFEYEIGAPEVPHFNRLVAIPATAGIRVKFEALEVETLRDIELMPAQGDDPKDVIANKQPLRYDNSAYERDVFYPEEEAWSGEPAVMRGIRLAPVRTNPVRYNAVTKELRIAHRYRVKVFFEGTDLRNALELQTRPISRSWANLMSALVVNFDELDLEIIPVGSYLIVCEDNSELLNNLLPPLIDWKMRKGHTVAIETFSNGSTSSTIKGIIQSFYNQAEIPPEFVLLIGDVDENYALPGYSYSGAQIDHPYSQLEGNDILADVAVGRIPADNATEFIAMRNKILWYEKTPYIYQDEWYHQGCLIAGNSYSGISTIQTNRWIKTRMIENEFTRVDTFWYNMYGSVESTTYAAFAAGICAYNYRGNYMMENFSPADINNLTNGFKLPFVVTITCGTGGFSGSESFMEYFYAVGTPNEPKGAIAAIGTATIYTHTRQNNTIAYGIWSGVFDEGLTQAGNALNRGKLELYNAFQAHNPTTVTAFSNFAALAGDPGVELFNRAIQYMTCDIPSSLYWGENSLSLTVFETGVGPLEEAVVSLYKEGELHEVGLTDAWGQVTLPLSVEQQGNVKVTVTKQNFYPIVDSLNVIQADVSVGYYSHSVDDDNNGSSSGDNDGTINPTEAVEIPLVFKNYGSSIEATSVDVIAICSDTYITLGDSHETFPNISAGSTANSIDDLDITIAANCPHEHIVHLDITVSSDQGDWTGGMDLEVVSSNIEIISAYVSGGDTLLTPGATESFILSIANEGGKAANSMVATLASTDPYVTINDNTAGFGTVNPGEITTCSSNPFSITADENTPPGRQAEFSVVFTNSNGSEQTVPFSIKIGQKYSIDPQGPDEYGYYCFDNTDILYSQAPVYNWVEINPSLGGSGAMLAINDPGENQDQSVIVSLPFTFRFYGVAVDDITVCSNGWIAAISDVSYTDFRNYPIPSIVGPSGMIAPFWDDLITWSSGKVYSWYDEANHRFVVEWSRVKNYNGYSAAPEETFELILFDPAHYPTTTGDGEILFQYEDIIELYGPSDDIKYSTVGIERFDQQDGIQIVYWNTYDDPAAAHLENGRAYLFTTNFDYNPPGGSDIAINLTYQSGSPVPLAGGDVVYDLLAANVSTNIVDFDIWLDIEYEGGEPTTIVQRSINNFQPGWTINRPNMIYPVPSGYATGDYIIAGRVGEFQDEIWDESSFQFKKDGLFKPEEFSLWIPDCVIDPFDEIFMGETAITLPEKFELLGSYPNPFNPSTKIGFALPEQEKVTLSVYDISGRVVATLIDGYREAGLHEVVFEAKGIASGLYIYRIEAGNNHASGKIMLLK